MKVSDQAYERSLGLMNQVGIPQRKTAQTVSSPILWRYASACGLLRLHWQVSLAAIIADEPTTALDVSIQDQILGLIRDLCIKKNVGCMLVTHDMGVVSSMTDRVAMCIVVTWLSLALQRKCLVRQNTLIHTAWSLRFHVQTRKLDRFPLVGYIEAHEMEPLDVKNHWLGQSQITVIARVHY